MDNKYVLAMYDIRSKQEFIYRSNSIKEIVGGSLIIRDCFQDYLYPAAKKAGGGKGIYTPVDSKPINFTSQLFEEHLAEGYVGEIVYDGGGNFVMLFKDLETYKKTNYEFTKAIYENIGTLQILPTYIENINFEDYQGDINKIYKYHKINEGKYSFEPMWGTLPIVQVDDNTSMPLVKNKVSQESYAKLNKFNEKGKENNRKYNEKILDQMVYERGKESLLAVIYADGNNMGVQVETCIAEYKSYEDCVRELRRFSKEIQKNFIDEREDDIDKYLKSKYGDDAKRRFVIGSGDEITFICNARDAFDIMKLYLEGLPDKFSSCAGAAVFHSHMPYSEAYRIAEECCESGKQYMKKYEIKDESFMDCYFCQGAIGISLNEIRKEEVGDSNSKPWYVPKKGKKSNGIKGEPITINDLEICRTYLNRMGRGNVKGLADEIKNGRRNYIMELKRIRAHLPNSDRDSIDWAFCSEPKYMKLVYDMVIFYDIWFRDGVDAAK